MHSEILSVASFACADGGPLGGPPPGSRWVHFACAAWKAGEAGLIPEPCAMRIPPPPLGSGKFGTPFARMHSANLRNPLLSLLDEPGLDEPETFESLAVPPQAAIATTQPRAANPVLTSRLRGMACVLRRGA